MTTVIIDAPDRSHEQRREALRRANAVRAARAHLKQSLRAQPRPAATERTAHIVRAPEDTIATMKVSALLLACPGMGQVSTGRLLRRLGISPTKTIAGLSPRQRDHLGVALDELARRRRATSRIG
ncbi:MAG TPA: integration host factor, actinobacterial type [Solirubrobacteraceae bacterium]|nr:integration host factor, actinobacterial type [Solirubrobacteraceae bacterium]